jgi:tetratricopeptide (TPR) repeat protein
MMALALFFLSFLGQAITPEVIEHAKAGTAALEQGKLDIAIEEFRKVTELQPNSAPGYVNLGDAYFRNRNYDLAIPQLEHALKLNPNLLSAHQTLGVSLLVLGNAAEAIPHLERAPSAELLGLAYLETGRLADAIGAWQKALGEHPNDPDVLYFYSQATALASKQAFNRLLAIDPDSARAHEALADRDVEMGRLPDALKEYQASLRLKPYSPGVHLAAGKALVAAGNLPAAVLEFRTELSIRPSSAETYYYLGTTLIRQGQGSEALTALSRADQIAPNTPGTLLAISEAASLAGDKTRAENSLMKLLEVVKEGDLAAQAHLELADLYRKAGKSADADRETAEYEKLKGGTKQ